MSKIDDSATRTKTMSLSEENASTKYLAPDGSSTGDAEKQGGPANIQPTTILHQEEAGDGTETITLVTWDGSDDPANPINWSTTSKFTNIGIVSALTFLTPLASSMFAPGIPLIENEFQNYNEELASFVLSVYVLGFAIGPMVLAPMSELYGRLYVYHACNIGFLVFTIACALSTNMGMLTVNRFFQGCFGAAPVTNGGGTIADLVVQEKRGVALAIASLGPLLGPVIGPVAGGYLIAAKGWRWVFWALCILIGFLIILYALFLDETYGPVVLARKAARLRKETGDKSLSSTASISTPKQVILRNVIRPAKMLMLSPIVLICSLYIGIAYGYQYLLFTTLTTVFQNQYNWSTSIVGLSFLGFGIGSAIGLVVMGSASDRILKVMSKPTTSSPSGAMKPEYRLPPMLYGAAFIPAGLFIYGWTAQYKLSWIVPILGTGLFGIGNFTVFMCITTYMVDAFSIYAASAIAAITMVRSVMGAVLPLGGQSMYNALGLGWGNSLLAFIAVGLLPVCWAMTKHGERLRTSLDTSRL